MAVDKIPDTQVHDGLIAAGTTGGTIITPNLGKRMVVVGFRLQVYDVTVAGQVELVGRRRTKVSGAVRVDANGLNYVQDRIRVPLDTGEVLRLLNTTDGAIQWCVFLEEHSSAVPDVSV